MSLWLNGTCERMAYPVAIAYFTHVVFWALTSACWTKKAWVAPTSSGLVLLVIRTTLILTFIVLVPL